MGAHSEHVFSGLWSGLLAMLTTVRPPMLRKLDGLEFVRFMRGFLPTAGWEAVRERYFALNWIRSAATWVALVLFIPALAAYL
jgi:hypothetical protein